VTTNPIAPHCHSIAYRMFLATADLNYIGARSAHFERRDWDFWWLTLHAVEKYLKTMLLVNGHSSKGGGHDLPKLFKQVGGIDARLVPPALIRPEITGLDQWPDYPDSKFFQRLNDYGSPSNRYGLYGYTLMLSDLLRADQLIYWARRHARPLKQHVMFGSAVHIIDEIDQLAENPRRWQLHAGPIEEVAALPENDVRRRTLVELNAAFFPELCHEATSWRSSATNAPIPEYIDQLKDSCPGSESRAIARGVLEWVLNNIQLGGVDSKILQELLAAYPLAGSTVHLRLG
jgi:HEPN domain-containing protein